MKNEKKKSIVFSGFGVLKVTFELYPPDFTVNFVSFLIEMLSFYMIFSVLAPVELFSSQGPADICILTCLVPCFSISQSCPINFCSVLLK